MVSVQTNIRIPSDVREWLQNKSEEDGRTKGEVLARIIRPLMDPKYNFPMQTAKTKPHIDLDGNEYQSPVSGGHPKQPLIPAVDLHAGFDDFWNCYPKKKAKADALKAWKKNKCHAMAEEIIFDVCDRSEHDPSWADKQYVPNGATYLNGKRWEDEIIQQDNRPKFEQQGDALREQLFGKKGETYDH